MRVNLQCTRLQGQEMCVGYPNVLSCASGDPIFFKKNICLPLLNGRYYVSMKCLSKKKNHFEISNTFKFIQS